jgi:hypothetical protein
MANPGIKQLQNDEQFELLAELNHQQIKEFVIKQLTERSWLVKSFMIYQVIMLMLGVFIITQSIFLAFEKNFEPLYYVLAGLVFCFSLLILIHELLHGIAIKLTGAPKVNYGAYFKKFIFYAEADRHVLNKKQFAFIALTPLVVIKIITLLGIVLFLNQPIVFFLVFVMCAHSLFCAGDIGLLSTFYKYGNSEVYTFDLRSEKTSYYYRKKS